MPTTRGSRSTPDAGILPGSADEELWLIRSWTIKASSSQTAFMAKSRNGSFASPVFLVVGDLVLDPVATLERGDVSVLLVGEDRLEAMAVRVGELKLGAGMGALAAEDHPRAGRPALRVEQTGDLGDRAVGPLVAVLIGSGDP